MTLSVHLHHLKANVQEKRQFQQCEMPVLNMTRTDRWMDGQTWIDIYISENHTKTLKLNNYKFTASKKIYRHTLKAAVKYVRAIISKNHAEKNSPSEHFLFALLLYTKAPVIFKSLYLSANIQRPTKELGTIKEPREKKNTWRIWRDKKTKHVLHWEQNMPDGSV